MYIVDNIPVQSSTQQQDNYETTQSDTPDEFESQPEINDVTTDNPQQMAKCNNLIIKKYGNFGDAC